MNVRNLTENKEMNRYNSKTYWDTFPLGRKDGSFEEELLYRNRLDYIFSEFVARGLLRKIPFSSVHCRLGQGSTFLPEILLCQIVRHYTVSEWRNYLNESGYKECRVFPDYSGIGRFWPWLGKYFDKITMGKLGYYLFWKSIK